MRQVTIKLMAVTTTNAHDASTALSSGMTREDLCRQADRHEQRIKKFFEHAVNSAAKPAAKRISKPVAQPTTKPAALPAVKPAEQPAAKPTDKRISKPAKRTSKLDFIISDFDKLCESSQDRMTRVTVRWLL